MAVGRIQDAEDAGFVPSQVLIGEVYRDGEGVERSDGIAWGWLLNRYAQRLIGDMVSGAVATMDLCLWRLLTTGTRWRRPGTMARLESNARIGIMPQDGGVATLPKDEVRALEWFDRAVQLGYEPAEELKRNLSNRMQMERLQRENRERMMQQQRGRGQ